MSKLKHDHFYFAETQFFFFFFKNRRFQTLNLPRIRGKEQMKVVGDGFSARSHVPLDV